MSDFRRFQLLRHRDSSGVSGPGIVADGAVFPDAVAVLHWRGSWPSSVVFYDRGIAAVEEIHGHLGDTEIVWLDE